MAGPVAAAFVARASRTTWPQVAGPYRAPISPGEPFLTLRDVSCWLSDHRVGVVVTLVRLSGFEVELLEESVPLAVCAWFHRRYEPVQEGESESGLVRSQLRFWTAHGAEQ